MIKEIRKKKSRKKLNHNFWFYLFLKFLNEFIFMILTAYFVERVIFICLLNVYQVQMNVKYPYVQSYSVYQNSLR